MACAALHWTPADFWQATPHELGDAVEALNIQNGAKPDPMKAEAFDTFRRSLEGAGVA